MKLQNPLNYSSEQSLIRALKKVSKLPIEVKVAIWLQNVKYVLISKFNYSEKDASQFIAMWSPKSSIYAATA